MDNGYGQEQYRAKIVLDTSCFMIDSKALIRFRYSLAEVFVATRVIQELRNLLKSHKRLTRKKAKDAYRTIFSLGDMVRFENGGVPYGNSLFKIRQAREYYFKKRNPDHDIVSLARELLLYSHGPRVYLFTRDDNMYKEAMNRKVIAIKYNPKNIESMIFI